MAAQKLHQRLSRCFGASQVGIDKQFAAGINFEEAIQQEVGACEVLIVVIGKDWLRCADEAGRRRLDKEGDHVRSEILTALERGIRVVPVLVDGAEMPERMHLPSALDELGKCNAVTADGEGVKKLIKDIESVLEKRGPMTSAAKAGVAPEAAPRPAIAGTVAYLFAGHAIGAAAHFNRLDDSENLSHVVPALGGSVVPGIGGMSRSSVSNYSYRADYPRPRTLLMVDRADSLAAGQGSRGWGETEVDAEVEGAAVIERVHVEGIRLHLVYGVNAEEPGRSMVRTRGARIEGVRAGGVEIHVELDEEPLVHSGSIGQLAEFYRQSSPAYRQANAWRFGAVPRDVEIAPRDMLRWSLARNIRISGAEKDLRDVRVDGNRVVLAGFGKIVLGEVLVDCAGPRVTMVRVEMSSDAQGVVSFAEGHAFSRTRP